MKQDAPPAPGRFRIGRPSLETNLALLAGGVAALGLPPYPWTGVLVPFALALLFVLLARAERPGRLAWMFGLAHQTVVLHWLFLLIPAKSIPTRALVPMQAIGAIVYVSVAYLLLGWIFGHLRRRLGRMRALLLLPALWAGMEFLRAGGEMGFPWCLSGSCVVGTPLLPLARAAGELGIGAGLAFVAMLVAVHRLRGAEQDGGAEALRVAWIGTAVLCAGLVIGSFVRPETVEREPGFAPVETLRAAAIQADVDLEDKWIDARIDSTTGPYAEWTAAAARDSAEFIVWAETSVPAYIRYDKDLLNWTRRVVRDSGAWLYAGFPDAERHPEGRVLKYNSSGLFDPAGTLVDRYAKHHLLPIGEAMPFSRWLPFLAKIDVGQAEWTPGDRPQPMRLELDSGSFDFSGLICFESAFAWLARHSVRAGSQCLVVLTNDGWFGRTAGPRQHTALAQMRAAECAVPMIRCANNGISFVCDAEGRLLASLDLGRRGRVIADIEPGRGDTVFVRWGNRPLLIFLLVWCGLAMNVGGIRRPAKEAA